ncbi:MAG: hexitol phosphatase HxpB [Vicingaceae bacterium]|nr:hexitol phosphatase HxpB [Vicingaceae bacterium]
MDLKAVIYDMDGVIIDSEPLWREAEILTFGKVGLTFTEDMCRETMGMRLFEVVEYWHNKTPWEGMTIKEVEKELLKTVTSLINKRGVSLEGVKESLDFFKSKNYKIALASSSAMKLIITVINKLELIDYFDVINSAENLPYGKPHPEVFIKTANELGELPVNCLVIEDSFNGLIAAKAALMKTIVVPDEESKNDTRFNIADFKLNSLLEIETLSFEY